MSKDLEALKELKHWKETNNENGVVWLPLFVVEDIEKSLKALEIIKNKNVDIWILKSCLTVEQYNFSITKIDNCKVFNLTKEDFELLKRYFK